MSLPSPSFYKHLLANSTDLLSIIDGKGFFKFHGDSVKSILGYEIDELVGVSAFDYIHPEDVPKAVIGLQEIVSMERLSMAFRFRRKDGAWRWLDCSATNLLDDPNIEGIITNSRDITEVVESQAEKSLHQAYYKALFNEHPDAVFSLDTKGYFQSVNKNFSAIAGYTADDVLYQHFLKFIHPSETELANAAFEFTLKGATFTNEIRILDAAGDKKLLSITLMPVYVDGMVGAIQGIAKDITELKLSQRVVKSQALQLSNLVESISEPFFALDSNWCFSYVNKAFCSFIGQPATFFLKKEIWKLFPTIVDSTFYQKCHEVATDRNTQYFEDRYVLNKSLTLSFSIFPSDNGISVHFYDSTAQIALQNELEKLSLVASKTINGVVIMDPERRVEWVNDGFTRLTGYTKDEVLGKVPSQFLQGPLSNPNSSERIKKGYESEDYFTAEIINYHKSGRHYWVKLDVSPIRNAEGELINYIAIQTDITEKKKAEAEQLKLADDLYKQNINLQQFTYMVSHNLRAPVANALGLTSLIKKLEKHTPQYDVVVDKIHTSIAQLDGVIKDINSILSVRDSAQTLPREKVNLLAISQEVITTFNDDLKTCGATVNVQVDESFEMESNRAYLYSIFYNLISNAIKYQAQSRLLKLNITIQRDKRGYEITISDNGMGMDMHVVESQLFKLYKRFHPNTPGKGIGLFLVKTQVEAIGGKIIVSSTPDKGTTFKILLGTKHV